MSASDYQKFHDILTKIAAPRGLNREQIKSLVAGQEIFLILDGTYSYKPTIFTFTYVDQFLIDSADENSAIILKVLSHPKETVMEVNCSDFNIEPINPNKKVTLRRMFIFADEAKAYFDDIQWCDDVRVEEQLQKVTYYYIYKPPGTLGSSEPPVEPPPL